MTNIVYPERLKSFYHIVLIIVFFVVGSFCQAQVHLRKWQIPLADQLQYLPSGTFLKGATLAYDSIFADYLFIKGLAYFGDQYVTGHNYSWLYSILDSTTTLDPYFEDPYEFGGIVLANEARSIEKSTALLKKGVENVSREHPRYWRLLFFLGFNYWYHNNDFKTGAEYLEVASRFPQAPSYLPMLTARMYADASQAEMALPFLDEMINCAKTPERRGQLVKRKKEVVINRDLDMLDRAVNDYRERFHHYPASLNDLVLKGVIQNIPEEPFGAQYYYDIILHRVFSTHVARIKIHERKIFN